MRSIFILSLLLSAGIAGSAHAQSISNDTVKIGVLSDLSGPYSDLGGQGSIVAAKMAVKDFSADGTILGKKIEILSADHQNKPDIASVTARRWFDNEGVDAVAALVSAAAALSVMELANEKDKVVLVSGSSAQAITTDKCSPNTVHWNYPIYSRTTTIPENFVKAGKKKWFFITGDWAAAAALERETTKAILANGGEVLGSAKHPLGTSDFSSLILTAQASGADVIALANAGNDTINTIKQAKEFGVIGSNQIVLPMVVFLTEIHALGLQDTQGLQFVDPFYWDKDASSRAWAKRYFEQAGRMPTSVQASVYSSIINYLKAVQAAGTDDTATVMKTLKSTPVDDGLFKGTIRDDGSVAFDELLVEVKAPADSKGAWDYYTVRQVIPAEKSAYPIANSTCSFLKK